MRFLQTLWASLSSFSSVLRLFVSSFLLLAELHSVENLVAPKNPNTFPPSFWSCYGLSISLSAHFRPTVLSKASES